MNTIKKIAITMIAALAIVAGLLSTPAHADSAHADSAHAEVDSSTIVFGQLDAKASIKTVQATGLTVNGKPVVAYVKSNPRHWNPKKALKVRFVSSYWKGVKSGKPFRLRHGKKFPDTYKGMAADMTTYDVALKNRVKGKWQLFDFKKGQVRNRGFWNGKKWKGDCANPKPSTKPTTTIDDVKVVRKHNQRVTISGDVAIEGSTSGVVSVTCTNSSASARYSAEAHALVSGSVSVRASTRTQAIARGASKLAIEIKNSERARLALNESAEIELEGAAEAQCSSNPPEVVYDQPSVNVTPVACVNPGETRNVTVRVSNPNNNDDVARLTYSGNTTEKSVAANGQVTFTFANQAKGTYNGNVLLVTAGKSRSFTVTVEECPIQPGSITNIEQPNDVLVNNTRTIRVRGVVPAGQTATLKMSAVTGTIKASDEVISVTGSFDKLVHYTASSEAGSDTVTADLFSSTGVKDDTKSVSFEIRPAPVDPL
jgi:hypothetical protein